MKLAAALLLFPLAAPAAAALPANTVVAFWVLAPAPDGAIAAGMPPRFVLLDDGRVFVGGTQVVMGARLPKGDVKPIEKLAERARKVPGFGPSVSFGEGDARFRVFFRKGGDVQIGGDPARAGAGLRPLATLVETLSAFTHPLLQPIAAESFVVGVEERALEGGCRRWTLPVRKAQAQKGPAVMLPAVSVAGWPTGGYPASVCEGDKRYAVTLRPLLPGETP
jgi:hypothetical protein